MIINNNNSNYNNITLSVDLLPLTRLPALVNTTTAERKRYDLVQWNLLSGRRLCSTHLLRSVSHSLFFCIIHLRLCNDWQHHGMMGAFHTWGLWSGKEQVNTADNGQPCWNLKYPNGLGVLKKEESWFCILYSCTDSVTNYQRLVIDYCIEKDNR